MYRKISNTYNILANIFFLDKRRGFYKCSYSHYFYLQNVYVLPGICRKFKFYNRHKPYEFFEFSVRSSKNDNSDNIKILP